MKATHRVPLPALLHLTVFISQVFAQTPPGVTPQNTGTLISTKLQARATWDSNAFYQIYKQRSYENLVLLSVITQAYRTNPSLDPKSALAVLNRLHEDYRKKYLEADEQYHLPQDAVDAAQSMLNLAGAYGGRYAKAAKPLADELLKWGVKGYESYEKGPKQIDAQRYLSDTASYAESLGQSVDAAWILSDENSDAKEVITTYFGNIFNANPGDSAAVIKKKNSDFKLSDDVDALLTASENTKLTVDQLRDAVSEHNRQLAAELGKATKELADLSNAQAAYVAATKEEERQRIAAEADKARYEINIEGAKSSVYLLATFANFLGNSDLAHTISTTGNATIQVVDGLQKYNAAISVSQTSLAKVATSVTLAANWVGAGLAIASLMQPGGNTDQIIIDQLKAIRQQLVQLRQEMHERFDRIDLRLNELFLQMSNQFDVLVNLLNSQQVSLSEISATTARLDQALLQLNFGLTDLESRLEDYIKNGFNRDLDQKLEDCFGENQPTAATFMDCLKGLRYDALDVKLDPLQTAPVDDDSILKWAAARPLTASYGYMARIGGRQPFDDKEMQTLQSQVVNPVEWSFGVDAYLGIVMKWPQLANNVNMEDVQKLTSAGNTLRRMATASRKPALYKRLSDNYDTKLAALKSSLQGAEDEHAASNVPGKNGFRRGPKVFTYLPLKALSQPIMPCTWDAIGYVIPTKPIDVPPGIEKFVPQPFLMAATLGIISVTFCYHVEAYDEERSTRRDDAAFHTYEYSQSPGIRITALARNPADSFDEDLDIFDRQLRSSKSILWGWKMQNDSGNLYNMTPPGKDPIGNAISAWQSELRDRFVSDSTPEFLGAFGPVGFNHAIDVVNIDLNDKYDNWTVDFSSRAKESFDGTAPVGNAARQLTVAKLLIEDFLSIGYPDALQNDENLRSLIFGSSALPSGQDVADSFADIFRLPTESRRQKAQAALQKMNIQPSQEAFVKAVSDLKIRAVEAFLELGYWDNMSQSERAALMPPGCTNVDPSNWPLSGVCADLRGAGQRKSAPRYTHDEAALASKPYELLGAAKARLQSLSDTIDQKAQDPTPPRFPLIDTSMDRLALFIQFHPKPAVH